MWRADFSIYDINKIVYSISLFNNQQTTLAVNQRDYFPLMEKRERFDHRQLKI